ncbi:Ankyrin repeat domain-containing protein [Sulfidibacter corallicola]|uniref:Ankyrin repeat domain-containing protein n=1 Tax=Sulfidibacter corallicola TaxID=2818388 RepID=A0A8A4TIP1_SULCO|nr:ankyrin repeat domain-containing protein [Sulfidibacter corallicola]QTD48658.1 ankyrin repeat domain-containing protein [Sulfidibacter corallicola]
MLMRSNFRTCMVWVYLMGGVVPGAFAAPLQTSDTGAATADTQAAAAALHGAVFIGDLDAVAEQLRMGTDPNLTLSNRDTPLIAAAENGHMAILTALIQAGARLNLQGEGGQTALNRAVMNGRLEVVRSLLARGAFAHVADDHGQTPLMKAVQHRDYALIRLLVPKTPQIDHADLRGQSALMLAVKAGDLRATGMLLAGGASATTSDQWGNVPVEYARLLGNKRLEELVAGRRALVPLAPVYQALFENDTAAVAQMLADGTASKTADPYGRTLLTFAAEACSPETMVFLLEKGAYINGPDREMVTPLMMAVMKKRVSMVRVLLERGARPNYANRAGLTALSFAIDSRDETVTRLLMGAGANRLGLPGNHPPLELTSNRIDFARLRANLVKVDLDDDIAKCRYRIDQTENRSGQVEYPRITRKNPDVPALAVGRNFEGTVIVAATLGKKKGTFRDIEVVRGVGEWLYDFEHQAVLALKKWTYKPGRIDGKKADVRMLLKVEFKQPGS